MKNNSIILENLSFSYSSVDIFRKLTFEFYPGKIYTIMGPSGSGKSTLLELILGLKKTTMGRITIGQCFTDNEADFRNIGVMPQTLSVFDELSVWENLQLGYVLSGTTFPEKKFIENLQAIMKVLEIDSYLGENVANLSRGEKQRIALARCLAYEPPILVLDEPNSSLDYQTSKNVRFILNNYRKKENFLTIVFTHDRKFGEISDEILKIAHYSLISANLSA